MLHAIMMLSLSLFLCLSVCAGAIQNTSRGTGINTALMQVSILSFPCTLLSVSVPTGKPCPDRRHSRGNPVVHSMQLGVVFLDSGASADILVAAEASQLHERGRQTVGGSCRERLVDDLKG